MLLEVNGLTKAFAGLVAVKGVDFTVQKGEILGLIGPNGAGKTTIFHLLTGYYTPTAGTVLFNGKDMTHVTPPDACRLGLTRTFQIVKPLVQLTVLENVMVGAFAKIGNAKKAKELALEILEFTGQLACKDMLAGNLTLGMRKRLEVSRALATQPELLLLDETMAGLNSKEIADAVKLIMKIREKGITLVVIEHVMKAIMSISDRIVVINYGEKIMEGMPEAVCNDQGVIQAYLGADYAKC
ncbi:MAG: ABC transporter ATP-binding protein [Deltaproteobacteria bacterium]|nr:ABC transporter ATP-binding protein [Deltaproteobacteria bacterium]